jgi:hypothetical protein
MTNVDIGFTNSSEGSSTFDIAGDGGVHITVRSSGSQGRGEGEEGDRSAEGLWYAVPFYIKKAQRSLISQRSWCIRRTSSHSLKVCTFTIMFL